MDEGEIDSIIDDMAEEGSAWMVQMKAANARRAVQQEAEAAPQTQTVEIKPETAILLAGLTPQVVYQDRGRTQEKSEPAKASRNGSPPRITTTNFETGKDEILGGIQGCYESRERLIRGEITASNVAKTMATFGLDAVGCINEGLDINTFGAWSWAGDRIDDIAQGARVGIRRGVRTVTGDQQLGQNVGDWAYVAASFVGPKKLAAPAQAVRELSAANKVGKAARTLEALNLERGVASGTNKGLLSTDFAKNARAYVQDMENRSGLGFTDLQKSKLTEVLRENKFEKLDKGAKIQHGKEYERMRPNLIAEWERNTGNVWPTTLKIDKKTGEMKPVNHQFHHIIPQEMGGPNAWWNGVPLEFGKHHQGGVHGKDSPLNNIIKDRK